MIAAVVAGCVFGGAGCNVVVANQPLYGTHFAQAVSYPYSALAYKVQDPEQASKDRLIEKLTDQLIAENQELRARNQKLESAAATEDGGPLRAPSHSGALSIIQRNCMSCHSGGKAKGDFAISKTPSMAERILVNSVIQEGSMPPKDKRQLTAEEKKAISDWAVVSKLELKAAAKAAN